MEQENDCLMEDAILYLQKERYLDAGPDVIRMNNKYYKEALENSLEYKS